MAKYNFLFKLMKEGVLDLVDLSEQISKSYLIKSDNCKIAAKAVFDAGIYENAVSEAYYSMYNTVMALFYKCGIKCENHSAAVILIQKLFNLEKLYLVFAEMKKERIDNQYYVPLENALPLSKEQCEERLKQSSKFNSLLRFHIEKLTIEDIKEIRKKFIELSRLEP